MEVLSASSADTESKETEIILEIVEAVSKIAANYHRFGSGLGILPSKIEEIERKRKPSTTTKEKLLEVVKLRLRQERAPWKTFIDAAKLINPALANSMIVLNRK